MRKLLFLIIPLLTISSLKYQHINHYSLPEYDNQKINIPLLDEKYYDAFILAANNAGIEVIDLACICFCESSMVRNLNHKNKYDKSPFGLHETEAIHKERADKWGEYNPDNIYDSAKISALEYKEELDKFKDKDLAFSAYHRGSHWVDVNGVCDYYLVMVNKYLEVYCEV